jgi:hypothetical protein
VTTKLGTEGKFGMQCNAGRQKGQVGKQASRARQG